MDIDDAGQVPLKVLFVSSGNKAGGVDQLVKNQGESLKDAGLNILYFPLFGRGLSGYLRNVKSLREHVKRHRFDLVHGHFGISAVIAYLSAGKTKVVASFMGDDLLGSPGVDGTYTFASRILSLTSKIFARFFFTYNIVKSKNLSLALFQGTPHAIIPNGVNFSVFFPISKAEARQKLNLSLDKRLVLFPADPSRIEKRFELAQAALAVPELSHTLLLPIFKVDQERLNLYYNAADVVLLTSYHEGSPNVIKEAMACNRPIVSTRVGDVEDNISRTPGCFLSESIPSELAKNILRAFEFSETVGRRDIDHLESSKIVKVLINVYKGVLNIPCAE